MMKALLLMVIIWGCLIIIIDVSFNQAALMKHVDDEMMERYHLQH